MTFRHFSAVWHSSTVWQKSSFGKKGIKLLTFLPPTGRDLLHQRAETSSHQRAETSSPRDIPAHTPSDIQGHLPAYTAGTPTRHIQQGASIRIMQQGHRPGLYSRNPPGYIQQVPTRAYTSPWVYPPGIPSSLLPGLYDEGCGTTWSRGVLALTGRTAWARERLPPLSPVLLRKGGS